MYKRQGSLYPGLRGLVDQGLIRESIDEDALGVTRRARIAYELTADGKERFQSLVSRCEPSSWEDEEFDVHLAFFARTESQVRLRTVSYTHLDVYKRQEVDRLDESPDEHVPPGQPDERDERDQPQRGLDREGRAGHQDDADHDGADLPQRRTGRRGQRQDGADDDRRDPAAHGEGACLLYTSRCV